MATEKNEIKRSRSRLFVEQLVQHNSGMTLQNLQAQFRLNDDDSESTNGRMLKDWLKGQGGNLDKLQTMARRAIAQGLLPPLHTGGINHSDIFMTLTVDKRANNLYQEQQNKLAKVATARAAAVKALLDYTDALEEIEEDNGIMTFEAETRHGEMFVNEISTTHVRAISKQISTHFEHRFW